MSELIGHTRVSAYFQKALDEGFLSHTYLLTGSEGIGKRQVVLGVIRRAHGAEPGVNDPYAIVIQPDEKGTLSIEDHIRPLKKSLTLRPPPGTRLLVLIDRAESLTGPAAQSLLKILEEPPDFVTFFLVTATPGVLPETIRSRCIEIRCPSPTTKEVAHYLSTQKVPEKSREILARMAGGSIGWLHEVTDSKSVSDMVDSSQAFDKHLTEGIGQRLAWAGALAKNDDIRELVLRWLNVVRGDLARRPAVARALMHLYDTLGRSQSQKRIAIEHFVLSI